MTKVSISITKPKIELKKPKFFEVILINDDYTPMDFVIEILCRFFGKNIQSAKKIMLQIHNQGEGICGIYTYDIAKTKVSQVIGFSRKNKYPLMCIVRKLEH